ncbi:MAG: extracellular solute-binding protein [Chloroflexota bacterium]|nr:extracellular solute-binding protein [Chloroflexota bacterium]
MQPSLFDMPAASGPRGTGRIRLFAVMAVMALVFTACGGGEEGESQSAESDAPAGSQAPAASGDGAGGGLEPPAGDVAIEFWTGLTGADGDIMEELVGQFNSETPSVQVTLQRLPEYYTAINNAVQAGETPEVMIMHIDALARYAAEGVVQPVGDLAEQLGLSEEDYTPAVWAGTQWQGEQYSIPLDVHPQVLYYNRDLLEEVGAEQIPPTDREGLEDALQKCTDAGYDQGLWGNHAFSAGLTWATLFYQGGGEWTNEDYSEATFNSEAGVQASEYMLSLIEMGVQPQNVDPDAELTNLESLSSCFATTGIWQTTRLQASLGESFGEAPFPQIFDEPGNWSGSHTLALRADLEGDELQGGAYFIDWLTDHSVDWAAAGQLPARADVRESEEFAALADIPDAAPAIEAARFPPPIPGSSDLFFGPGGVWEKVAEMISAGLDPQEGLDAAAQQYTEILQSGKDEYGY